MMEHCTTSSSESESFPGSGFEISSISSRTPRALSVSSVESSPEVTACIRREFRIEDCKELFVEALVDSATSIIGSIWPSSTGSECTTNANHSLPLKKFIQETLKRSRTSYSTLQLALYYLILVKPVAIDLIDRLNFDISLKTSSSGSWPKLCCGRRTFLASLMLASKYLQDRNYSVVAWSKISGLSPKELNSNEIELLKAVDWRIHVATEVYDRWSHLLFEAACERQGSQWWQEKISMLDHRILPLPTNDMDIYLDCSHTYDETNENNDKIETDRTSSSQTVSCSNDFTKNNQYEFETNKRQPVSLLTPELSPPCSRNTNSDSFSPAVAEIAAKYGSNADEWRHIRANVEGLAKHAIMLATPALSVGQSQNDLKIRQKIIVDLTGDKVKRKRHDNDDNEDVIILATKKIKPIQISVE